MKRPLKEVERINLAEALRALADELTGPHANDTQQRLGQALQVGYPTKASGTPNAHSNQVDEDGHPIDPDTPTEKAALGHDLASSWAEGLLSSLADLYDDVISAHSGLEGWSSSPKRHVAKCKQCDVPKTEDHQCPEKVWPDCKGCGNPMAPGDRHGGRHDRCRQFKVYNGHDKVSAKRLELTDDLIEDTGVYHAG